ncbi:16S rRNA (uracil(1498)-N(3))-methyltransferase [Hydrogenimonas sp.]
MRFLYHPDAGLPEVTVEGEAYRYLFKVRRHKAGERVALRNLTDDWLHFYTIDRVSRREAVLVFESKEERVVMPGRSLHLGWCVVDPKTVEKTLPSLNELGVAKLSFIYCDYSQKNFRLDFERFRRILINSCQQCGRSRLMEIERFGSLDDFLKNYPEAAPLDFGGESLGCGPLPKRVLVGPEGGFSEREREKMAGCRTIGLSTPLILRSETAALALAAVALGGAGG